jgi:hypothetical protein
MSKKTLFATLGLLAGLALAAPAAKADGLTPAQVNGLAALDKMVTNMGYTVTYATDKSHIYFDIQGNYDYRIDLALSPNGQLVYLYNYIDTFDAGQMAKVPYQKMMEYQNSGNVFFSMDGSSGKGEDLYANEVFGYPGITPVSLRSQLDTFTQSLDQTDKWWNTKLWK